MLMKVTPLNEAPIIPKATKYQALLRPARKKFALPDASSIDVDLDFRWGARRFWVQAAMARSKSA
jgi:hypothetical protein